MLVEPRLGSAPFPQSTPASQSGASPAARVLARSSGDDLETNGSTPVLSFETLGALSALQVPQMTASVIARTLSDPEAAIGAFGVIDPDRTARLLAT